MNGINELFTIIAIVAITLLLFGTVIDNNRISGRHVIGLAVGLIAFATLSIWFIWK